MIACGPAWVNVAGCPLNNAPGARQLVGLTISSPVGGGVMLVIQGQSSIVVARLLPEQKEPNIQLRGPVKYAIETVPCRFTDNCGSRTTPPDEFGRTRQEKITTLTYLYLLDGDNRVSRLTAVNEHKLPPR